MTTSRWFPVAVLALSACEAGDPAARTGAEESSPGPDTAQTIRVAVQNLYVGADLTTLLEAPSLSDVPLYVAREFEHIRASSFVERAGSIAAELAVYSPHLIGLQEVALFRVQRPGDFLSGNTLPATDTVLDYLAVLLEALAEQGVAYRAVAEYGGMDIEVPAARPDGVPEDVRLTDRGFVLARSDVAAEFVDRASFSTNLSVRVGREDGLVVDLIGGWSAVEADVAGRTILFVTTHLESGDMAPAVQVEQALELLAALDTVNTAVVLVGDFSSTPDGAMTETYDAVLGAGFTDVWSRARAGDDGFTCCRSADLRNPESELTRRLDFIFFRDVRTRPNDQMESPVHVRLLGARQDTRTQSGLWASDHAGIAATLPLPVTP